MPDLTTSSDIDAFMQSADNAAARTSLGLGTAATSASTDFATAAQGAKADTALQPAEVKSSSFTAANDGVYVVVASATVTDPSPVEGKGFLVIVRNGTATVGGTGYSTAGQEIRRIFHSGGWANYVEVLSDDSRLSDARTPTAHASSHVTGGTDKIRDASASQDGLMTTAYASKLDGIEAGADVTDAANVAAAGAVMESDYDANTILAATSDNTPVALTVGEATMVGRQTGGAIAAIARVSAGEITAGTETALRAFSPKDVADMAGTHGGGGGSGEVVQVEVTTKTDTQTTTANNGTWADITDLAITVTTTAGQRVVVQAAISVGAVHATSGTAVRLVRAGSPDVPINSAATTSGRWSAGAGPIINSDNNVMMTLAHGGIDTPGAGTWTYKYQFCASSSSGSATAYINRSSNDSNTNAFSSRAASFMRLEVLAP